MKWTEKPEVVSFYTELLVRLIRDTAENLALRTRSIECDIVTLRGHIAQEGLSFVTKRLPLLARELDRSLATDTPYQVPEGFKTFEYGSATLPLFLRSMWQLVYTWDGEPKYSDRHGCDCRQYRQLISCFDHESDEDCDGYHIYDGPTTLMEIAVRAIRQICYLAYKLEVPYTREQQQTKYDNFLLIDNSLPALDDKVQLSLTTRRALTNASTLIAYVLKKVNPFEVVPRHGPGAVATGEKQHEKFNFRRFYPGLDEVYGYPENFFFSYGHLCDEYESLENMEYREHKCSHATVVPKDSRGPRLISMEPLEVQWIQQGLATHLICAIEADDSPTYGYVNFTDQSTNRSLARRSSSAIESGEETSLVTLDLEDASDRVSAWLVKQLFPTNIANALFACRSDMTKMPDGRYQMLRKFAPMGSACCFPVEALIFWALAVGSVVDNVTGRNIRKLPEIYVYGDDIIARKCDYEVFRPVFEELHLRFNENKCCIGTHFRESCGMDAFETKDVTPVRLHTPWVGKKLSPQALLAHLAYANAFRRDDRRYEASADFVESLILEHFGPLPLVDEKTDYAFAFVRKGCSRETTWNSLLPFKRRWNSAYDRWEFKLPSVTPYTYKCTPGSEWAQIWHLLELRGRGDDPFGFEPAIRAGVYTKPQSVKMRWTWVAGDQLSI